MFSKEQTKRLELAVRHKVNNRISAQVAVGYTLFSGVGCGIGFLAGSALGGLALGIALHSILLIKRNDFIELIIEDSTKEISQTIKERIRCAPKIVQHHYFKNLNAFSDAELKRWAANGFSVKIRADDMIQFINEQSNIS